MAVSHLLRSPDRTFFLNSCPLFLICNDCTIISQANTRFFTYSIPGAAIIFDTLTLSLWRKKSRSQAAEARKSLPSM